MEGDEASGQDDLKRGTDQGALPDAAPAQFREDQVQNAVSFLSHPKVRGSPKASKVSFLQQKGLTEAEIDEAFRRVPDTPVATAPVAPAPPVPSSVLATTASHLAPQPYAVPQQQLVASAPPQPPPLRWSQVALGAGFAAAGVYAVKSLVWPFVSDKYAAWRGRSAEGSEAAAAEAPPADVAAVADAIRAQTAEMAASIKALRELVEGLESRRRPDSPEDHVTAAELRGELRAIATSLNEIAAPLGRVPAAVAPPPPLGMESELSEIKAMLSEYLKTPRSGAATPSVDAGATPGTHRSSAPAPVPEPSPAPSGAAGRHPASYMEVLEMLERGETPPGIRDDINDKPPNPNQPPPPSRMVPPPKPWELRPVADDVGRAGSGGLDLSPVLPEDATSVGAVDGSGHPLSRSAPESASSNGGMHRPPSSPSHELRSAGRGAASIFEAATSSKGSPGMIAGRISPSEARRRGIATPTALFADPHPAAAAAAAAAGPTTVPEEGSEGSGLGRPASRGWRPPPIPVPTLSTGSTGEVRGWRGGDGDGGGGSGSGGAGTPGNASYASLGADFHGA